MFLVRRVHLPLLVIFLFGMGGSLCQLEAQEAVGGVRVSVQDADFSYPITGVSVLLEGTSFTGSTDDNGSLFFSGVKPGNYAVLLSKEGYVRERIGDVIVGAGTVRDVSASMTGMVVELDEYEVPKLEEEVQSTAISEINIETNLKSLATVLGKEFLSQTGASDVGKALSKATGINVVDGKFVVVRGLSDRYNTVSLNGARVPSSDPDRRAVPLDLFPASVVESISTSKTFLPFMSGESTGGSINVITKARPLEPSASVKIGTNYNTLTTGSGFLSYEGGGTGLFGTADQRALDQEIRADENLPQANSGTRPERAALVARKQRFAQKFVKVFGTDQREAPMDFSLEASLAEPVEFLGMPAGVLLALDYRKQYQSNPNDAVGRFQFIPEIVAGVPTGNIVADRLRGGNVLRGKQTMRAGALFALGMELPNDGKMGFNFFWNRIADDVATIQSSTDQGGDGSLREAIAYTERQISTYELYGNHIFDEQNGGRVDWIVAFGQTQQLEPDQRVFESLFFPPGQYSLPGAVFVSPFRRYWREVFDTNYSTNLDISIPLWSSGEKNSVFRFGGNFDYTTRDYRADSFGYDRTTTATDFNAPAGSTDTFSDVFFDLPQTANAQVFRINPPERYDASQLIASSFAMVDVWKGNDLNISFGARVEATSLQVQASPLTIYDPAQGISPLMLGDNASLELQTNLTEAAAGRAPASAELLARSRADIEQVDMLPALNMSWDAMEDWTIRAAITRTVARPSFKEIAPVPFFDPANGDIFIGNVDLVMSSIMNYDVRSEWKLENGGNVGLGFFAKSIRDAIELNNGRIQKFRNTPRAEVYGFELETQMPLDLIAEEFRDFTFGLNYTYIYSRADLVAPSIFATSRRLQGQPDYIFNASLTYDNKESGWYAGLFLNVTGPMLALAGAGTEFPDVLQLPVTTLDLGISYKITPFAKLTFRATNITNPVVEWRYGTPDRSLFSATQRGIGFSLSLAMDW